MKPLIYVPIEPLAEREHIQQFHKVPQPYGVLMAKLQWTEDRVKNAIRDKFGKAYRFREISPGYKSIQTLECRKHGEFTQTPNGHLCRTESVQRLLKKNI